MRLIVTSDLHYNVLRSKQPTLDVAEEINTLAADALLVLGDVAGHDLGILRQCLGLFDRFAGRRFFVAGNHDIWTAPGESSLDKYERILPEVCREAGFQMLDAEPAVIDGVGIAGSMAWYDYGFRPRHLEIPLRFYEAKIAPGAASRFERYAHLLDNGDDVPEHAMRMGTRWMDGEHVKLGMSDVEFCDRLCGRLTRHLDQLCDCREIVVGLHHVPFRELAPLPDNPSWAFAAAYLGSDRFGELLLQYPNVRHVFCGHTHRIGSVSRDHITCTNTGCTYLAKRYEVLEAGE